MKSSRTVLLLYVHGPHLRSSVMVDRPLGLPSTHSPLSQCQHFSFHLVSFVTPSLPHSSALSLIELLLPVMLGLGL